MLVKQLNPDHFVFLCPACDDVHVIGPECRFNGDFDAPSFTSSFYDADSQGVCHSAINNGRIFFHPDCTHYLSEQSVPLPPLPAWLANDPDPEDPPLPRSKHKYYYTDPTEDPDFVPEEDDWHLGGAENAPEDPSDDENWEILDID